MRPIYLERHESDKNLHRFYQLHVTPGIFGDWALVREWGRVGSPGTVRKDWFASEDEAIAAGEALRVNKAKNGYRIV
jgi:predicted DNA-binding WGR domain protein